MRKPARLPQQPPAVATPRPRTVQLKNISFKYPKPYQTLNANLANNSLPLVIKDRMKQPIANDKTRCAVLLSNNGNIFRRKILHSFLVSFSSRYFATLFTRL